MVRYADPDNPLVWIAAFIGLLWFIRKEVIEYRKTSEDLKPGIKSFWLGAMIMLFILFFGIGFFTFIFSR